jgi:hydroxymethylglutaryl-CoA reductase (NADPH)
MATGSERAKSLLRTLGKIKSYTTILKELKSNPPNELDSKKSIPSPLSWNEAARLRRLDFLKTETGVHMPFLSGEETFKDPESLKGNIEQYIGMTQIPTGVIGPVKIQGTVAQGDIYVPLATSEGALIASYNRGARATRLCGGITSVCLTESVQRAPLFKFIDLPEVGQFMEWLLNEVPKFQAIISLHSRHAQLLDMRLNMEGNQVIVIFEYSTGNAAGQNMVTICTDAICEHIIQCTPIQPQHWFIESNYSGDKKATAVSFSSVRGKKVTAEAVIQRNIVASVLHTTPEKIATYWQSSTVCTIESGAIGAQGHSANALTALFLACGQDVACVAEAYVGITRMEVNKDGNLYVSVTLPSLMVGTIGGGTHLPTQKECLQLLGCEGEHGARKFAEICGATVLCGELSIAAAIAAGDFSKAHRIFGRKNNGNKKSNGDE